MKIVIFEKISSTSPHLRRREVSGTLLTLLALLHLLRRLGGSYLALFLHVLEETFEVAILEKDLLVFGNTSYFQWYKTFIM